MNIENIDKAVELRAQMQRLQGTLDDTWSVYVKEEAGDEFMIRVADRKNHGCNLDVLEISRETYNAIFSLIDEDMRRKIEALRLQIEML
jgi:hypothetical protein